MIHFAKNIKHLRKSKKLSQGDLANALGKSVAVISSYETGRAEPNITTLVEFANYFSVSSDDLLLRDLSSQAIEENRMRKTSLEYAQELEEGKLTIDELANEVGDENLKKIIKLLELRVNELEQRIKKELPEVAKELKIE